MSWTARQGISSFYIFLKSTDSKELYLGNTPGNFRVRLPESIKLNGQWVCGLEEIKLDIWNVEDGEDIPVYVTTRLVNDSIVGDKKIPVLRQLFRPTLLMSKSVTYMFDKVQYFPLKTHDVNEIDIIIRPLTSRNGISVTGVTHCVLCFQAV